MPCFGRLVRCDLAKVPAQLRHVVIPVHGHAEGVRDEDAWQHKGKQVRGCDVLVVGRLQQAAVQPEDR